MSLSYRPDLPPLTPEVIRGGASPTGSVNFVPTNSKTFRNVYSKSTPSYPALSTACMGAGVVRRIDGTLRLFASIAADPCLYEANQVAAYAWTDVSRAAAYTTATSWDFAQLGNVSLAASYENVLQFSNGAIGTAFADVTGSPKGSHIIILNNRVILLNTQGYTGSGKNGWAASHPGTYFEASWPPATANNAAYGTLTEVGGDITAANVIGSLAIAWKRRGMWIGRDEGAPNQIVWQKIPGDYGCVGKWAHCTIENGIVFMSDRDIFLFDGTRPRSITDGIRKQIYGTDLVSSFDGSKIKMQHDEINNLVIIYLNDAATSNNISFTFNYKTGEWGRQYGPCGASSFPSNSVEQVVNASSADLISIPNLTSEISSSTNYTATFYFDASHRLTNAGYSKYMTVGGAYENSSQFVFSVTGDGIGIYTMRQITPVFVMTPDTPNNSNCRGAGAGFRRIGWSSYATGDQIGGVINPLGTFNCNPNEARFDGYVSARYVQPALVFAALTGDVLQSTMQFEIADVITDTVKSGAN